MIGITRGYCSSFVLPRSVICYGVLYSLTNTQNGDLLEGDPPAWASWESDAHYLPDIFYKKKSSASLSVLIRWTASDPITADDDALASYQQVELVILAIGLALRGLWITQFPENYADVPAYIINSPYPFSEYEQLSHTIQDLITGYADTYVTFSYMYSDCHPTVYTGCKNWMRLMLKPNHQRPWLNPRLNPRILRRRMSEIWARMFQTMLMGQNKWLRTTR